MSNVLPHLSSTAVPSLRHRRVPAVFAVAALALSGAGLAAASAANATIAIASYTHDIRDASPIREGDRGGRRNDPVAASSPETSPYPDASGFEFCPSEHPDLRIDCRYHPTLASLGSSRP